MSSPSLRMAPPRNTQLIAPPQSRQLSVADALRGVFATDQLEHLHRKFGTEHLLIGTDFAFDMGEYDPIEHVLQTPGIDADAVEQICGGNAVKLFGLDPATCGRADFERGKAEV